MLPLSSLDSRLVVWLAGHCRDSAFLTAAVVALAQAGPLAVAGLVAGGWLWPGPGRPARRRAALAAGLAGALALVVVALLGGHVARVRPFVALGIPPLFAHGTDSSFPSDHTFLTVALAAPLVLRRAPGGGPALALALATGAARVAAAVHYPSDVLASAVLAVALGAAASYFVTRWLPELLAAGRLRAHPLGRRLAPLLGLPAA
jgi:undecaprenyl-diphosphatase